MESPERALPVRPLGAFHILAGQDRALGVSDRQRRQLKIRRTVSAETMSGCDLQTAAELLAQFVARAYAADHPDLFSPRLRSVIGDLPNDN